MQLSPQVELRLHQDDAPDALADELLEGIDVLLVQ
jgi:hypothetical protein